MLFVFWHALCEAAASMTIGDWCTVTSFVCTIIERITGYRLLIAGIPADNVLVVISFAYLLWQQKNCLAPLSISDWMTIISTIYMFWDMFNGLPVGRSKAPGQPGALDILLPMSPNSFLAFFMQGSSPSERVRNFAQDVRTYY